MGWTTMTMKMIAIFCKYIYIYIYLGTYFVVEFTVMHCYVLFGLI